MGLIKSIHSTTMSLPTALSWNLTLKGTQPSDYTGNHHLSFDQQIPCIEEYLKAKNYDFLSLCAFNETDVASITRMLVRLNYAVTFFDYKPKPYYSTFFFITGYKNYTFVVSSLVTNNQQSKFSARFYDSNIETSYIQFTFRKGSMAVILDRMFDDSDTNTLKISKVNHTDPFLHKL